MLSGRGWRRQAPPPGPSHTTGRAGPNPAVRRVEVPSLASMALRRSTTRSIRCASSVPERSVPFNAVDTSPLCLRPWASPRLFGRSSSCPVFWRMVSSSLMVVSLSSPFGPSLHKVFRPRGCCPQSGFAAATMASADFSLRPRRGKGFRSRGLSLAPASLLNDGVTLSGTGEISPGKRHGLRCTVAGYTPHRFGRESFAEVRPLTLGCTASNPVSVRRPTASALHFLQPGPHGPHVVVCLRSLRPSSSQDFHLMVMSHAGRTNQAAGSGSFSFTGRFARFGAAL